MPINLDSLFIEMPSPQSHYVIFAVLAVLNIGA
jgi:hypothetical protein